MAAAHSPRESNPIVDKAACRILRGLAAGEDLSPMLRRLLTDALVSEDRSDRPCDPDALVSSAARAATAWIDADPQEREKVLRDLLELSDALPPQTKGGPSLPDKVSLVHGALTGAQIAHAFGGALAVGFYGEPRATGDIVRKAMLDRPKDWHDIEQILVATPSLNLVEIDDWFQRLVSRDDPRIEKLRELETSLFLD